jgi:uncharacterized protein (DUF1697 family)
MAELRSLCEDLGYANVRTFIQSGNVIFSSSLVPKALALEAAIEERCAIATDVIFRSAGDLKAAVKRNPFPVTGDARVHVGFLAEKLPAGIVSSLDHERFAPDEFKVVGSEVYLFLPTGVGQSKLPPYLVRQMKRPVTLRNWSTVTKLVELASEQE